MLRNIIGPIRIQGFPEEGIIYLDTLVGDLGYGKLDGLFVESFDGRTQALVSTVPLVSGWLGQHRHWLGGPSKDPPLDMAASFTTEAFYTQAFEDDTYYYKFAELPVVTRRRKGFARAILFEQGQDLVAPNPPDGIAVSVVMGGRVFVFKERTVVGQIPVCKAAYEQDRDLAGAVFEAYRASHLKNQALFQKYTDLQDAANSNFQHCFQSHLAGQGDFAALVRQAQELVDRIE